MNIIDRIVPCRRLTLSTAALMAGLVIAGPGITRADGAQGAGTPSAPSAQGAGSAARAPMRGVDGLIAHLHGQFQITPAQEDLFQKLATVMREDAATMRTLAQKRAEGAKTMTAVDDLKSYAEISEAHAEGAKKMIPAFQALYDSMSEAQKKAADAEFRNHYSSRHRRQPR